MVIGGRYNIVVSIQNNQVLISTEIIGTQYNRELQKRDTVVGINVTLCLPIIRAALDYCIDSMTYTT